MSTTINDMCDTICETHRVINDPPGTEPYFRNLFQLPVYVQTREEFREIFPDLDKAIVLLEDGFQGVYRVREGIPPADPLEQVYIVFNAPGYYGERIGTFPSGIVTDRESMRSLDTGYPAYFDGSTWLFSSGLAVSDPLEGLYVSTPDGSWVRQGGWAVAGVDVRWFGAKLDDSQDDTDAFNAALAIAHRVNFPAGRAYITDMLQVKRNRQLIGIGVSLSVFSIKADFNLSAPGIVRMGTSENTGLIDKIGFEFYQPDSTDRDDMICYPYAVCHRGIPRVRIGHIRISRGWNGIDASLNAGGATYDWIECGTLNKGLYIDGALDTMNIGRFRVWPFGMSAYAGAGVVYRDGQTKAAVIGKCDGLEGEIHAFSAAVDFIGSEASAGRHLHALHLDGDGSWLRVLAGVLDISYLYCTKSGASGLPHSILLDGSGTPDVRIANLDLRSSQQTQSIVVNTGALTINGGQIDHRDTDVEAALVQGGSLTIRNTKLVALGARTKAYVAGTEALTVQNCNAPANGGSGVLVQLMADHPDHMITGNKLGGRTITVVPAAVGRVAWNMN